MLQFILTLYVPTHKMVKHTEIIFRLKPTNWLSAFDHFVGMPLKGLKPDIWFAVQTKALVSTRNDTMDFVCILWLNFHSCFSLKNSVSAGWLKFQSEVKWNKNSLYGIKLSRCGIFKVFWWFQGDRSWGRNKGKFFWPDINLLIC